MKKFTFYLFVLLFSLTFQVTGSEFTLIDSVKAIGTDITSDHLSNCYIISSDKLYKYDPNNQTKFLYSDMSLGEISSVDASDPYKILLFYKELSEIIFLDNTLSALGNHFSY